MHEGIVFEKPGRGPFNRPKSSMQLKQRDFGGNKE